MHEPRTFQVDLLDVQVFPSMSELSLAVARAVQTHLSSAIATNGFAAAILATGDSQIRFLEELIGLGGVEWSRVTLFHMDEYLGISAEHPASFRRYMRERVASRVSPRQFHYIDGDATSPEAECARYAAMLAAQPIDLCCLGLGENGHLAFNDPHAADFEDPRAVKVVRLSDESRQQQVGEGHFPTLDSVPTGAITLTLPTLLKARKVICLAPEARKARAVRNLLRGPVSPECPASILRNCPRATLFLDEDSAALL